MSKKENVKVLVILGDGGHTAEMIKLVELIGPKYEYSYLMVSDDHISENKIQFPGPVYRVDTPTEKDERRMIDFITRAIGPIFAELRILMKVRPKVILSTGPSIAVPAAVWGRLLGMKVIHVETGSRVYSLSSTGKLMYRIANLFFVQWEPVLKDYPKAIYAGRLL